MSAISTIRHDEIFDAKKNNQRITIIGAGATGSRVFAALVELGLTNIAVYDPDVVEPHNIANQLFIQSDIGMSKVSGLSRWYQLKTGYSRPEELNLFRHAVEEGSSPIKGVVFLLTDTMASRREIFEHHIKNNVNVSRVIETRMASTHGDVYVFNPHDYDEAQAWIGSLVSDDDAEVSSCGASISVGTTASIIANMAVWQFMHLKTDEAACDSVTHIFLKPFCISTEKLHHVEAA